MLCSINRRKQKNCVFVLLHGATVHQGGIVVVVVVAIDYRLWEAVGQNNCKEAHPVLLSRVSGQFVYKPLTTCSVSYCCF